ncbi:MAG: HAMP domain-containing sensor histidine kinase [Rhodanobacter sp.]
MDSRVPVARHAWLFRRRNAWVFGLQFIAVIVVCVMGVYDVAPPAAVVLVIVISTLLAWFATGRSWRPVRLLARIVSRWDTQQSQPDTVQLQRLSQNADADVASLALGLQGFAGRLADYHQRERNFTRDASHELRSPLTVIKMSIDMLAEEPGVSEFGTRSIHRIKRATLEMEALVEALLILARESDVGLDAERFVVNDVLRLCLESSRELLAGRPVELQLEEPARFALNGSAKVFSVLCWQLIRNACQQTERGRVVVMVSPGAISVSNNASSQTEGKQSNEHLKGADRHGFELAIAKRISDRFAWPLELQTRLGQENIARIRFPHPLPADDPVIKAPLPAQSS